MGLKNSYFALPSITSLLQRWLTPPAHRVQLSLRNERLTVSWSRRAERELQKRRQPLLAEMQLYFSCVVKKRVLFHQQPPAEPGETLEVNDHLQVAFRPVEASSCDPLEFAANYPVRREFDSHGALRMHPSRLHLDFVGGRWVGEFTI